MKECPGCHNWISPSVEVCPLCGRRQRLPSGWLPIMGVIAMAVLVLCSGAIGACAKDFKESIGF